mmetsp:Transcript_25538/g.21873  ORF Transcript_25538/g.21873 Transcript_25538/m.21873 type:complete len:90 (-) Transcript_25538:104-373(-)
MGAQTVESNVKAGLAAAKQIATYFKDGSAVHQVNGKETISHLNRSFKSCRGSAPQALICSSDRKGSTAKHFIAKPLETSIMALDTLPQP